MNPKRSPAQILSAVFGFLMLAVSTPCVLAMLNDLFIVGTDNTTGALIVGTFMGFVGIAGLVMMFFGLKKPASTPAVDQRQDRTSAKSVDHDLDRSIVSQELEREVLTVARDHSGRLTVANLAVETELSLEESKHLLEYLVRTEVAQTHVSQGGNIVYVFPGLSTNKMAAVNPLDDLAMFDAELASEEVVFDQGMDGNVELDTSDESEEVAVEQQQNSSEKW